MLLLPANNLRLAGDHAGHQRHVSGIVSQAAFLTFARHQTGYYHQFYHVGPHLEFEEEHEPGNVIRNENSAIGRRNQTKLSR